MLVYFGYPWVVSCCVEAFCSTSQAQRFVSCVIYLVSLSLNPAFLQHVRITEPILCLDETITHSSVLYLGDTCFGKHVETEVTDVENGPVIEVHVTTLAVETGH